ncbi:hypothetical protein JYU34_002743 [Plutella xylostella]|uniref:Reelin domain-containing protein n=2 Tax=Plutella xylostella TaxID=51655 RepID=A0ABQ7R316_PLUXY|nr:putative defense protein Hdd11 [Plutella xylostella]KAG7311689.1 hypothetical protein JYU34_002743 [Plutella xylostella]
MLLAWVAMAAVAAAGVQGYSSGAPDSACQDMVPRHPVSAQKSAAPYSITTSSKVVKAGQPLQVVISGRGASNTIRGLLLQARQGGKPVGKFTVAPNDSFAKTVDCGGPATAVSHKKHDEKDDPQTVTYTWTPPAGFNDEIKFRATIALNGAVFWVGVESAPIKVSS